MKKKKTEWDQFTRRIYINAPPQKLYNAWAVPGEIIKWFLESAVLTSVAGTKKPSSAKATKGDSYKWKWFGSSQKGAGKILAANGKNAFSFSFADDSTIVHVRIKKVKARMLVELEQNHAHKKKRDRKFLYLDCFAPWSYHLTNMKSILEGGIDLREKNPDKKSLVNA